MQRYVKIATKSVHYFRRFEVMNELAVTFLYIYRCIKQWPVDSSAVSKSPIIKAINSTLDYSHSRTHGNIYEYT
jgi:hypothetical protein